MIEGISIESESAVSLPRILTKLISVALRSFLKLRLKEDH